MYGRDRVGARSITNSHPIWSVHFLAINSFNTVRKRKSIPDHKGRKLVQDTRIRVKRGDAIYGKEMYGPDWMLFFSDSALASIASVHLARHSARLEIHTPPFFHDPGGSQCHKGLSLRELIVGRNGSVHYWCVSTYLQSLEEIAWLSGPSTSA